MPVDIEKRNKRINKWIKENSDRINFMLPKGTKEKIQAAAAAEGVSPSAWIRRTILEKLGEQLPENQVEK
jgi:predicted HicB family RNase H-like nuclease